MGLTERKRNGFAEVRSQANSGPWNGIKLAVEGRFDIFTSKVRPVELEFGKWIGRYSDFVMNRGVAAKVVTAKFAIPPKYKSKTQVIENVEP